MRMYDYLGFFSDTNYYKVIYENSHNQDLTRNYDIAPSTKIAEWYPRYVGSLERFRYERALNWAFARELLPYFMAMPELWEQVGYLHRWDDGNSNLQSFLNSWSTTLRKKGHNDTIVNIFKQKIPIELRIN